MTTATNGLAAIKANILVNAVRIPAIAVVTTANTAKRYRNARLRPFNAVDATEPNPDNAVETPVRMPLNAVTAADLATPNPAFNLSPRLTFPDMQFRPQI